MKSLTGLLSCVLADASAWCDACTSHDFKTIMSRVEHEGLSFLTITLPSFAKDFERGLELGIIETAQFIGFHRLKSGLLPRFLSGLTSQVFDPMSGVILDVPNKTAIFFIRQICLLFKKMALPCTDQRIGDAYAAYIKCEREVWQWSASCDENLIKDFGAVADLLWGNALYGVNFLAGSGQLRPKHGPGATAERISGNGKYIHRSWPNRLSTYFPVDSFALPNLGFAENLEDIDFLEPEAEMPVRVITVPKTLKTPRIIGIEPVAMQYCQQSILDVLVPALERSKFLRGCLGFTDQLPNQRMALDASKTKAFSTLDLSEASDRVSNRLVNRMFETLPDLQGAIQACRSSRSDVPGHGITLLAKFASMGSALCFPIEAMVFLTITLCGILKSQSRPVTLRNIDKIISKGVRIYGDDIVVPVEYASIVTDHLHLYGLKVNVAKSFTKGNFRESCGMDAYDGLDITPVYVRRLCPESQRNAKELISWTDLRNQLYRAGLWNSSRYVQELLERIANFPAVTVNAPVLGWHTVANSYRYTRLSVSTQSPMVKGLCVNATLRNDARELDDYGALMKFFLKRSDEPTHDVKHLLRSGRPVSVTLRYRWSSPF